MEYPINLKQEILNGKIFIYPTDTIYGLGCDATNEIAVGKLKNIKQRDKDKPLSVIAPSFDWIKNNFIIDCEIEKYLPGPYTVLLKKKDRNFLAQISSNEYVGIRIPANDFTKKIQAAKVPFVTTSVNLSGESFITKVSEIKKEIFNKVDYIIDFGKLNGTPSTLVKDGKYIYR